MLSVANGGYLFIYFIYIIFLIRVANLHDIKHAVFQYHHNKKESSKEKLKTVQ